MNEPTTTPAQQAPSILVATLTYMLNVQETGQTFPLPASIATDDNLIKRSLASVIPYIDTAKLERSEPKRWCGHHHCHQDPCTKRSR